MKTVIRQEGQLVFELPALCTPRERLVEDQRGPLRTRPGDRHQLRAENMSRCSLTFGGCESDPGVRIEEDVIVAFAGWRETDMPIDPSRKDLARQNPCAQKTIVRVHHLRRYEFGEHRMGGPRPQRGQRAQQALPDEIVGVSQELELHSRSPDSPTNAGSAGPRRKSQCDRTPWRKRGTGILGEDPLPRGRAAPNRSARGASGPARLSSGSREPSGVSARRSGGGAGNPDHS